jgi:hypothetical protein
MAMARPTRPILGALLLAGAVAGCSSDDNMEPPAEFITARRAWLPGERQALIDEIVANHAFVFPFVGDLSDLAPQLYADTDSVVVLVPNPAYVPTASVTAPLPRVANLAQFSASWNFVASKITVINTSQTPPDTTFWHMAIWSDPADAGNHGFAIAFSRANTFNISPIKTPNFNASFGKSGAGAGEVHTATATYWEDDGNGGTYQVTNQTYPGAFSAITTGPYLGGQIRTGTQFGKVTGSNFVRVLGTQAPATFKVSFNYTTTPLSSVEIMCVFPTPCTSNTLRALLHAP